MIKRCAQKHSGFFSDANKTKTCDNCRTRIKNWREGNTAECKKYGENYRKQHIARIKGQRHQYRIDNKDRIREIDRLRNPHKSSKLKREVINAYGGPECFWCGEVDFVSLTIDHINNNGAQHRREIKAKTIYRWLKRNNFPLGFQVLCCNCNHCKQYNRGKLPEWRKDLYREMSFQTFTLDEYVAKNEIK